MKFLLASDIHGAAKWCEKLMHAIKDESPDKVLLLGDLLYHGPRNSLPASYETSEVSEMLNSISEKIIAVRGNCDSQVDQMVLDFPCSSDYTEIFDEGTLIYCTHGHIHSPDNLPKIPTGSIFASGHTHIQILEDRGGVQVVNPGSVGLPRDGVHGYAIIDGGKIELRELV